MADADLQQLELLSLVNKITQEINNYIGINDKTLAEFIIALHDAADNSLDKFKAILVDSGNPFPDSFITTVDRLILTLHPKYKKRNTTNAAKVPAKANDNELSEIERKRRMFPGLAVKDKEVPPAVSDDDFLMELGDLVAGKKRPHTPAEEDASAKRRRQDGRASPRGRSPSPRRGDGRSSRGDNYGNRNQGRRQLDDKPVLFKIYDGKVTGIKDFGAFVTLEGVAGRVEGTDFSPTFFRYVYHLFFCRPGPCV